VARQYIFQMSGIDKTLADGRKLLEQVSLSFYPGAKIGILGVNGSGKSTVLRIMAGIETDFEGRTWIDPGAKVGFLSQEPQLDPEKTVRENIELGVAETRALLDRFDELSMKLGEDLTPDEMTAALDEQAKVQDGIDSANAWELDRTVDIAMDALRVPRGDLEVTNLSGGERRRVALCALLLAHPDLLLLDEPTNHLDTASVAWLEHYLRDYSGTVILVTHDRYFLDNVVGWILELDYGRGIPWEGNYSSWLEQKQKRLAVEEKKASAQSRTIARELEWVRMGVKARQAKSKSRLKRYEEMLSAQEAGGPDRSRLEMEIPAGPRLGDVVVRAQGLRKAFGDKLLFEHLTFDLPRNGIVGIVGANGAGKTTLFNMIAGHEPVDRGELEVGETVSIAHIEQLRGALDSDKSVYDNIAMGLDILKVGKREIHSRAYVSNFGFKGGDQQKRVGDLSGGERNRVYLAMLLRAGGNLILLDEPSNDLDVGTLRALEEGLENFAGCAVVISHDRWFLDRVATHILAFEGNSETAWFEGNFQEYAADYKRRTGAEIDEPTRLQYKRLKR